MPPVAQRHAGSVAGAPAPSPRSERPVDPYATARRPNRTGLPDRLKAGVEALSGLSLDDVRVHRGSTKPARLDAEAYARGTEIHLGPGQERHLPHEAWHVVQQMQGRVAPTRTGPAGVPINDHGHFEQEASLMGDKALAAGASPPAVDRALAAGGARHVVQMGKPKRKSSRKRAKIPTSFEYKRRQTAYGRFAPSGKTGLQGPHTEPHIMKKVIAEMAMEKNPDFSYRALRGKRTGLAPSPGQVRKHLRRYEDAHGISLPEKRKQAYDRLVKRRRRAFDGAKTEEQAASALNAYHEFLIGSTYKLGQKYTDKEIAYKGENRHSVWPDIKRLKKFSRRKSRTVPELSTRDTNAKVFDKKFERKKARALGKWARGIDDLSDYDTSSDEEY